MIKPAVKLIHAVNKTGAVDKYLSKFLSIFENSYFLNED